MSNPLSHNPRFLAWILAVAAISYQTPARAEQPANDLIGFMGGGGTPTEFAHVLGFINPNGTEERFPDFKQPDQRSWVFGPLFSDGERIILCSYEKSSLANIRTGKVVTHDWIYHLTTGELRPAVQNDRQADSQRPYALIPGDERLIETAYIGNEERIFLKDLDGKNSQELTAAGGGFHYALELSHDGRRLACYVTGGAKAFYNPGMYNINVFDLESGKRTLVAGQPEHLLFGPRWSPDDKWLAYLDCHAAKDPAHFRASLAVGRADGTEHRVLSTGQTHWFGTPFGSNMTEWSPDGETIAYSRLQDNSQSDMSAGGSQLCLLNPQTGTVRELTKAEEGVWDYRAAWSPSGDRLLFTRARKNSPRELWIMHADSSQPKRLTDGYQHKGADFARWLKGWLGKSNQ